MCDLNGPFKLCSCHDDIDYKKPHWILKRDGIDSDESSCIVGSMNPPDLIDKIQKRKMLRRLNTVNVFDFDYSPFENDRLSLVVEEQQYDFLFKNGKWNYEEFFGMNPIIEHKSESKGYVKGTTSKLKSLYKEYKTSPNQIEIKEGFDFVKCGWSSFRLSEKKLITLLEDALAGKEVKLPDGYEPTGEDWY